MAEHVWRARVMSLLVLMFVAAGTWVSFFVNPNVQSNEITVTFIDVGQGDATLIETPGGAQVLIDGGAHSGIVRGLSSELPLFDRDLDLVIATHPDTDHVGGLVDVLERYDVDHLLLTEKEHDAPAAQAFARAAESEGASITMARRGQTWQLDASTTLEVLYPERDTSGDENNASSIITKLTYGDTCFLFTGDAPKRVEEYLVLAYGEHLKCNVLKIGHHGSRTSTSELFLAEVDPEYAVISAAADNPYGHPHVEVTDLLFNERVEVYETKEGNVRLVSDGTNLTVID